jgi:hypothetical protein
VVEFFLGTIVCPPTHPFGLRREIPFIRFKAADRAEARFDFRLSVMRSIIAA